MTGATINAILALIAVGFTAAALLGARYGRRFGYQQGYQRAYAEQDLLVDELQAENRDLEQRNAELSKQMGAAA
jgi:hypothetical protein